MQVIEPRNILQNISFRPLHIDGSDGYCGEHMMDEIYASSPIGKLNIMTSPLI